MYFEWSAIKIGKLTRYPIALDIWSVGTIMLSFLSGKFPIFNANDDVEALMEIAAILGKRKMEKCAQLHSEGSSKLCAAS